MRPLLLAAALLAASPAWAQRPIPDVANSPGLQCWGIRGGPSAQVFVFAAPDTIADEVRSYARFEFSGMQKRKSRAVLGFFV